MPRGWRNPVGPNPGMLHEEVMNEQQEAIGELVRGHEQAEAAEAGHRPWWKRLFRRSR